jgi:membrane fusion protein (multidrug efflux system)
MKAYNTLFISGVAALFVALVALKPGESADSTRKETPQKETNQAAVAAPAPRVPVDAYAVKASTIEDELQTTGTIGATQEVDLVSEVARKVTGIYAREGGYVPQGTLLFKLDDADLQARRKKLTLQEKLALLDEKRFRELLATESVNQQEYDQVLTNLKVLQAEIGIVDVDLAKTRIRAPFAGKIGLNRVDVGAYVTPSTVLSSLEDVRRVEINFTVPEKYASEVKPGQTIRFTTENSSLPFRGKIVATEPRTDLSTRSLLVKAVSDNPDGKLVPGSSAKVQFSLRKTEDGILVPSEALIPTPKGYSLFAVKNGQAEPREVKTGNRTKATVQILAGLSIGDTVITSNLLRLGPGVPVQVVGTE